MALSILEKKEFEEIWQVTGGQGYDWKYGGTGNTYWGGIDFYASRVTPVAGEVRPVNRAVRYLIRAR